MTSLFSPWSMADVETLDAPCWCCCTACVRGRGPRQTLDLSGSTESSGSAGHDGSAQFRSDPVVARQGPCLPILFLSLSGRRNTRSVLSTPARGASEYGTNLRGQAVGALDN